MSGGAVDDSSVRSRIGTSSRRPNNQTMIIKDGNMLNKDNNMLNSTVSPRALR